MMGLMYLMPSVQVIKVIAGAIEPIRKLTDNARVAVSGVCGGVDGMHVLGSKALVIRAEVYPKQLPLLVSALELIGVRVDEESVPNPSSLDETHQYPMTLQITSYSDDTDGRVRIPNVPG